MLKKHVFSDHHAGWAPILDIIRVVLKALDAWLYESFLTHTAGGIQHNFPSHSFKRG